jgi:hypothetical protein
MNAGKQTTTTQAHVINKIHYIALPLSFQLAITTFYSFIRKPKDVYRRQILS